MREMRVRARMQELEGREGSEYEAAQQGEKAGSRDRSQHMIYGAGEEEEEGGKKRWYSRERVVGGRQEQGRKYS